MSLEAEVAELRELMLRIEPVVACIEERLDRERPPLPTESLRMQNLKLRLAQGSLSWEEYCNLKAKLTKEKTKNV